MALSSVPRGASHQEPRFVVMRALAILLVVYIHSSGDLADAMTREDASFLMHCGEHVRQLVHVAVPVFVMLSGALLLGKSEPPSVFYLKRLKRVLIPFLVWSPVIYVLECYKTHTHLSVSSLGELLWQIISSGTHAIHWYVYLIVSLYLLTPYLRVVVQHVSLRMLSLLCGLALFWYFVGNLVPGVRLARGWCFPWCVYFFYFLAGYIVRSLLLRPHAPHESGARRRVSVLLGGLLVLLTVLIEPAFREWSIVSASVGVFVLLINVPQSAAEWLAGKLSMLSRMSYGIYLFHFAIISFLARTGVFEFPPVWGRGFCIASATVALNMLVLWVLEKLRLGKWVM